MYTKGGARQSCGYMYTGLTANCRSDGTTPRERIAASEPTNSRRNVGLQVLPMGSVAWSSTSRTTSWPCSQRMLPAALAAHIGHARATGTKHHHQTAAANQVKNTITKLQLRSSHSASPLSLLKPLPCTLSPQIRKYNSFPRVPQGPTRRTFQTQAQAGLHIVGFPYVVYCEQGRWLWRGHALVAGRQRRRLGCSAASSVRP